MNGPYSVGSGQWFCQFLTTSHSWTAAAGSTRLQVRRTGTGRGGLDPHPPVGMEGSRCIRRAHPPNVVSVVQQPPFLQSAMKVGGTSARCSKLVLILYAKWYLVLDLVQDLVSGLVIWRTKCVVFYAEVDAATNFFLNRYRYFRYIGWW